MILLVFFFNPRYWYFIHSIQSNPFIVRISNPPQHSYTNPKSLTRAARPLISLLVSEQLIWHTNQLDRICEAGMHDAWTCCLVPFPPSGRWRRRRPTSISMSLLLLLLLRKSFKISWRWRPSDQANFFAGVPRGGNHNEVPPGSSPGDLWCGAFTVPWVLCFTVLGFAEWLKFQL